MCGITGFWSGAHRCDTRPLVERALTALRHRGPDGQRIQAFDHGSFGMVRLALVDLSERGQQPIWSCDGRVAILFNGEMYNFRTERHRLEETSRFRSSTDTEVALALYLERGPSFVELLRGMFALAILDWREADEGGPPKLILARDRFGIKPLYVAESGGGIAFASEIKALLASGLAAPEIDPEGLASFLRHGFLVQPRCIVRGVRMLEAGTVEIHPPGAPAKRVRFGSLPPAEPRVESLSEAAQRLREVLEESVALHAFADAPVGAFLSGGVDSTAIVGLMRRNLPHLRTYSLGWAEGGAADETADAEATARRLGTEHRSVRVSGREVAEFLPRFARDLDQPSVDGLNTWFVSRIAAQDVKGVLSGLGADEWFAGYPVVSRMTRLASQPASRAVRLAARGSAGLARALGSTRAGARLDGWSSYRSPLALWLRSHSVFSDRETEALLGHSEVVTGEERIHRALGGGEAAAEAESVASLACRLDAGIYMRSQLLRDSDAASMAHSLELRVPFVDAEVAAFARSCDDHFKVHADGGGSAYGSTGAKRVLIEAVRDLLPPDVENRPKRGFAMPYEQWLSGPLREIAMDTTCDATVRRRGLVAPEAVARVRRAVERRSPGATYPQLWSLMMLELWCRGVLDASRAEAAG